MERQINWPERLANWALYDSKADEKYLRETWDKYMSQAQRERLLARFHYWVEADVIEELEDPFSGRVRERDGFVGNWPTHASGGYFETMDEALDDGLEALFEEWDASYVLDIYLEKDRCPIKECREAAELMRLERNRQ